MTNTRIILTIMRDNNMGRFLWSYLAGILAVCVILIEAEPGINSMPDALWYVFALVTSTGFGDLTAVTFIGRLASILLGVYSIFVIALITAVVVDYYQEKLRIRQNESILMFLDKMEHLQDLSQDELADMSDKVRQFRKKRR